MMKEEIKHEVGMTDPAMLQWLRHALDTALRHDPVDVANDAEILAATLAERCERKLATSRADQAVLTHQDDNHQDGDHGESNAVGERLEPPLRREMVPEGENTSDGGNGEVFPVRRERSENLCNALRPSDPLCKPLAISGSCLAIPTVTGLAGMAIIPFLPGTLPLDRLALLMVVMAATYAAFSGIVLLVLVVERRLLALRGKPATKGLAGIFLAPLERHGIGLLAQPRMAVAMIASIFAILPGIPLDVALGLGFYVGTISAVSDMADRQLRAHRAALRPGEVPE
ncbi:hypothetical protein [Caenispirillum bisanense]|uniref:hypothetical protein n=1 Tax=Caenispirillum bisanense TaxID=414052 RepID=UPI0031D3DA74